MNLGIESDTLRSLTAGDDLLRVEADADTSALWENSLTQYGSEVLDGVALENFYRRSVSCGRLDKMPVYDPEKLLTDLGLFREGYITNAGFFLFSNRRPAVLKMAVFMTELRITSTDPRKLEDNVYNLVKSGISYIKELVNWKVEFGDDGVRRDIPEIPVEAVREIVVNSFAHADYRANGENEISITPTRVEIRNPGTFPTGLSPEIFARHKSRSLPRNRVILNTLCLCGYAEMSGSGFRKVFDLCARSGTRTGSSCGSGNVSFTFSRISRA